MEKRSKLVAKKRLDSSYPASISSLFKQITNQKLNKFNPDSSRIIARPFIPSDINRIKRIIGLVQGLNEDEAKTILAQTFKEFSYRHKDMKGILMNHFNGVAEYVENKEGLSTERKLLIGSYFTNEYSIESAALFNPSIVVYPKQNNLKKGETRVILSFRAVGEGHISSIVFRSAVIDRENSIFMEPISRYVTTPSIVLDPTYGKHVFELKLKEMSIYNALSAAVIERLGENFDFRQLQESISAVSGQGLLPPAEAERTVTEMSWLANSNYEIIFPPEDMISERVIFPTVATESNGVEDARFVRFINDDGAIMYYATYTAYSGFGILPQLIETKDFHHFKMTTLNGKMASNKGMALFPRKINGKYAMISRLDGESLYMMYSNNLHFWNEASLMQKPAKSWEFVQIGNCGSPIETEKGWLLLTHGVGPMRKYCIGIELLDLNDPSKIIARLDEPLLSPEEEEREGYVPNVVYSCGSIVLNNELILPYATSDSVSAIAVISLDELLGKLRYL
ncbi:MAG: glycoside hydrolase family 130 protein [bacterium]